MAGLEMLFYIKKSLAKVCNLSNFNIAILKICQLL